MAKVKRGARLAALAGGAAAAAAGYTFLRSKPVELEGRVALVTGGGGGLGRCLAVAFARAGCDVVLWDLSLEDMEVTRAAVLEAAPECRCWLQRVDVSDQEAVRGSAAEAQALAAPRHVSVLVNNAGISGGGGPLLETSEARLRATFAVNALAHVWTVKAFLPAMLEAGFGHIVCVASIAGLLSAPCMLDYAASKAAAVSFAEGLRRELYENHGGTVRMILVCPAHIRTPLFQGFKQALPSLEPEYVAEEVLESVRRNREVLTLPRVLDPTLARGLLPTPAFDAVLRLLGMGSMMNQVDASHGTARVQMMASSKL